MRLQDEIKDFNVKALASIPPEAIKVMTVAAEKLAESGIVQQSLKKDDVAPPFSLPNLHGQVISSENLLKRGPLVINFYRGSW